MSVQVISWAYDQTVGSATEKAVLLALANAANHHTGRCDPDVERIASEIEVNEKTVRRALVSLVEKGYIARERKRNSNGSLGTYSFSFPALLPDTDVSQPPDTVSARPEALPDTEAQPTGHCARSSKEENRKEPEVTTEAIASVGARGELVELPPRTAQTVVGDVVDVFAQHAIPITTRHRGMLGRQAAELLQSGFDYEVVVLACVTAQRRGEPHNAHFIAADLVTARAGQRITRRDYERALQDEVELAGGRRGAA